MELLKTMMSAIKYEVCSGKLLPAEKPEINEDTLKQLYALSKEHDLAHLVGAALDAGGVLGSDEISAKFRKQVLTAVFRRSKQEYDYGLVCETLKAENIPFLPLKGAVLCGYYPETWMRTSCDIDVLVKPEDTGRAAALLIERCGFTMEKEGFHDYTLNTPSNCNVELHFELIEHGEAIGKAEELMKEVWEHSIPVGDTSMYAMSDEMFYYYHIAHMAKHFLLGGCGIRPFVDIWVLNHRIEFDAEKRRHLLEKGGLSEFAESAELLSEVWLGNAEHSRLTRIMEAYLTDSGTYGSAYNYIVTQQAIRGNKFKHLFFRIWQPYIYLVKRYPSLKNHRWLLPVYEVRRWAGIIFCGRTRRSIDELKVSNSVTERQREAAREMLDGLKLMKTEK